MKAAPLSKKKEKSLCLLIVKLDFQISKTQLAIAYETQSKKKFEYNARLKQYKEEREKLLIGVQIE